MQEKIAYGVDSHVTIEFEQSALITDYSEPSENALSIREAVAQAFAAPIGYPVFAQSLTPSDRLIIAVDRSVPQAPVLVAAVVDVLTAAGVDPDNIAVLHAPEVMVRNGDSQYSKVVAAIDGSVRVAVHDPDDSAQLAYLAADEEARPIYLNRGLCDADVVIPIVTARVADAPGYFGVHGGLYPSFADAKAIARFRAPVSTVQAPQRARRCAEAQRASWLLGIQFAVQVIPGPKHRISAIVAGQIDQVAQLADQSYHEAWSYSAPRRAELVIATIPADADCQTWDALGQALVAAGRICEDGGTILVCSDIASAPGKALGHLMSYADDDTLRRRVLRERSSDALTAALLLESRGRQHVYLLSRLDRATTEGLGMGFIASSSDIQHLVSHSRTTALLPYAQYIMPTV